MEEKKNYYNPLNRDKGDISKIAKQSTEESNYIIKFRLTRLFGARIIEEEDEEGNLEKGVFIPIDRNDLKVNQNGDVDVYGFVNKCFTNSQYDYWTHYIRLKGSKDFVKKINSLGYKTPYLGNMKSKNYIVNKKSYDRKVNIYKEEE